MERSINPHIKFLWFRSLNTYIVNIFVCIAVLPETSDSMFRSHRRRLFGSSTKKHQGACRRELVARVRQPLFSWSIFMRQHQDLGTEQHLLWHVQCMHACNCVRMKHWWRQAQPIHVILMAIHVQATSCQNMSHIIMDQTQKILIWSILTCATPDHDWSAQHHEATSVSYTHLTLPTIYSV